MIRCLIFCAFLGCSLLAVSPALGQEPKDEASAPPPATAPVTAEPADRPDLSPLDAVPAKAAPAETQIKIFKLENVAAKEAEKIITQLFGQDLTTLAADERSNHLIVRDDNADRLQNIEAILLKLDESAKKQHLFLSVNSLTTANPFAAEITGPGPGAMSSRTRDMGEMAEMMGMGNHGMLPTNRVDQAKAQYQTAEKHTAQLAAELQQRSKSNPKDPQILALKKQLQNAVADAFAKRQRLHKMELAELETRVQKVQESLNAREAIRDQIIERRVEELLNPNVNWDSSAKSDPKPAVQKAASIPAAVQGVIEFRDEKELVGISMGQNDGMRPQTQLHVFTGNRHLGRIEVVQVHPDKSVARILQEQPGVPMRPGDQVTNRWSLESGQQSPIGLPGPAQLPEVPGRPGKGDTSSLGPSGDAQDAMTVQLHILGPKGAALDWDKGAKDDALALGGTLPLRGAAETGQRVSFRIMNIPGREELQLWPSVELAPNNPLIEDFLKHNAIPVEFTAEDLDQFAGGNLITKVIYLFPRDADKKPVYELETLVSTKLDPGVDPVAEARRRGHVLAVVRLVRSISKRES